MEEGGEEVMLITGPSRDTRIKRRNALRLNYSSRQTAPTRVGWGDRPTPICHTCYKSGHFSPDCKFNVVMESERIVSNFDALNDDDRVRVSDTSYRRAKFS